MTGGVLRFICGVELFCRLLVLRAAFNSSMVYIDSWWPYILVGISFFAFLILIAVLCRNRLRVCPTVNRYDNGYPVAVGDAMPRGSHLPAMHQSASAAVDAEAGGFQTVAQVTTYSGSSPIDVVILPPPYSDQAPPSYSDAIKTHTAYSCRRTAGDQPLDPSRLS